MTTSNHWIEVTISHDLGVEYTFSCTAPEGARCRMTCVEQCESWNWDDHEHEFEDMGECGMCLMINEDEAEIYEKFSGEGRANLHTGEVVFTYEGDGQVTWDYEAGCKDHEWGTACLSCGIGLLDWLDVDHEVPTDIPYLDDDLNVQEPTA